MSYKLREAAKELLTHAEAVPVWWTHAQESISKLREALATDDAARGTMREAFEAWLIVRESGRGYPADLWEAWQAASRAAAPQSMEPACRDDGRCQYAIDHGAEGLGHCPKGKCAMPTAPTDAEWLEEAMRWAIALEKAGRELTFATASERAEFRAKREAALAALRAHLSTRPAQAEEWIACSERLPNPDSGEVLVWLWESKMYALDEWHMYREDPTGMGGPTLDMGLMWRHFDFDEVSHWRPLPAPPTKTKEQGS